jgi:hypothetical protein
MNRSFTYRKKFAGCAGAAELYGQDDHQTTWSVQKRLVSRKRPPESFYQSPHREQSVNFNVCAEHARKDYSSADSAGISAHPSL